MTIYEELGIISSGMAIIVAIISLVFTKRNMNKMEKISYCQSEFAIRDSIINAKNRMNDILVNANNNLYYKQQLKSAKEQVLSVYEEACAKYIDAKVDKKRFRKTYYTEIKEIVESDEFDEFFKFGSKYNAVKKVYSEWFYLEK